MPCAARSVSQRSQRRKLKHERSATFSAIGAARIPGGNALLWLQSNRTADTAARPSLKRGVLRAVLWPAGSAARGCRMQPLYALTANIYKALGGLNLWSATRAHTCTRARAHTHKDARARVHTHTRAHTNTRAHACTRAQVCAWPAATVSVQADSARGQCDGHILAPVRFAHDRRRAGMRCAAKANRHDRTVWLSRPSGYVAAHARWAPALLCFSRANRARSALIYYPYRYSGRIPDSQGSRRVPTTVHGSVARGPFHSRSTIACALGLCQIRRSSFMSTVNQTFDEKAQGKLDGYVVVSDAHVQQLLRCAHALGTPSLAPALARSLPPLLARSRPRSLAPALSLGWVIGASALLTCNSRSESHCRWLHSHDRSQHACVQVRRCARRSSTFL
jgi:hypothetical protein